MTKKEDIDRMLQRQKAAQRRKLRANDHKGGWSDDHDADLLLRLLEEVEELSKAMRDLRQLERSKAVAMVPRAARAVIDEAADIANFAAMLGDNLATRVERARGCFCEAFPDEPCPKHPRACLPSDLVSVCRNCGEEGPGCS